MSLYSEFLDDAKEMLADFGIEATVNGYPYLVMISEPMNTPRLEAGGFIPEVSWTVRFAASTAAWTASDGRVGGSEPTLVSNAPWTALGIGKVITCNGRSVRITGQAYKVGSAWITLSVVDDAQ